MLQLTGYIILCSYIRQIKHKYHSLQLLINYSLRIQYLTSNLIIHQIKQILGILIIINVLRLYYSLK